MPSGTLDELRQASAGSPESGQTLAEKSTKKTVRDTAILRLLYDLALRTGEVLSLDFADVESKDSTSPAATTVLDRTQPRLSTRARPATRTLSTFPTSSCFISSLACRIPHPPFAQ